MFWPPAELLVVIKVVSYSGIVPVCALWRGEEVEEDRLEEMSVFFNSRADIYDVRHIEGIDGGKESKTVLASFLPPGTTRLLDFGIGTGLELDEIVRRFPEIGITGIDLSEKMLQKIKERFGNRDITLFCGDYLTFDFGENCYDAVLSAMTLHHYAPAVKLELYRKIYRCLSESGVYLENDYMLSEYEFEDPQKREAELFAEYERLKGEQLLSDGVHYHFDTPCTVDTQKKLLGAAGFRSVKEVWREKNNVTLLASK